MANFESLIRPFQSVDVTYPRPRPKVAGSEQAVENVVFRVGEGGGSKTLSMSYSMSSTSYMDKVQKEVTEPTASEI